MASQLEECIRITDNPSRSVYALSAEISQNLGISKYTCRNYLLAKRKGYPDYQTYQNDKLRQRGFSNQYHYLLHLTEKKGFLTYKEYQKSLKDEKSQTTNQIGFVGLSNIPTPLEIIEKNETRRILKDAVSRLKPRVRMIIEKRFYEGATLQECARKLLLTRERVRQLQNETLEKLRKVHAIKQLIEAS